MNFILSQKIEKELHEKIPKNKQKAFVEKAVKDALSTIDLPEQNTLFDSSVGKGPTMSLYTDGGARGNPGIAGCGAVIFDENGNELNRLKKFLGTTTNNQAEYQGLIMGLKIVSQMYKPQRLECFLDSELVVKQMRGEYKVKNPDMRGLYEEASSYAQEIDFVDFIHIPRAKNTIADMLSNEAMDEGSA